MKAILFLLLALRASFASTCSHYLSCHCQDSKGTPNNTATETVCQGEGHGAVVEFDQGEYGATTNYSDCYSDGCFNNCSWRLDCQREGATGSDSSCRQKCNGL